VGSDDTTWNDDLSRPPFYDKTQASPVINVLFAALWDLILCRITKMSYLAPSAGRGIKDIFDEKIPAISGVDADDANATEKHLVSPELMAYLKWLIYTAPFKDPFAQPRGAHHTEFYLDWVSTFEVKEDVFRRRLYEALDIWYSRFPATKKRGRSSLGDKFPRAGGGRVLDDPEDDPEAGDAAGDGGGDGGGGD